MNTEENFIDEQTMSIISASGIIEIPTKKEVEETIKNIGNQQAIVSTFKKKSIPEELKEKFKELAQKTAKLALIPAIAIAVSPAGIALADDGTNVNLTAAISTQLADDTIDLSKIDYHLDNDGNPILPYHYDENGKVVIDASDEEITQKTKKSVESNSDAQTVEQKENTISNPSTNEQQVEQTFQTDLPNADYHPNTDNPDIQEFNENMRESHPDYSNVDYHLDKNGNPILPYHYDENGKVVIDASDEEIAQKMEQFKRNNREPVKTDNFVDLPNVDYHPNTDNPYMNTFKQGGRTK